MIESDIQTTIKNLHIPRWDELPNIALYLDQVVTLINNCLSPILTQCDNKKEDTILTKTMINNYVKYNLIEAPEKKKYGKNQLAKLFVICILKQVYSMNEINSLINIAITSADIQVSYDKFCIQFEEALRCTYSQKNFNVDTDNNNKYLLKVVILSCAYKIYPQNITKSKNFPTK